MTSRFHLCAILVLASPLASQFSAEQEHQLSLALLAKSARQESPESAKLIKSRAAEAHKVAKTAPILERVFAARCVFAALLRGVANTKDYEAALALLDDEQATLRNLAVLGLRRAAWPDNRLIREARKMLSRAARRHQDDAWLQQVARATRADLLAKLSKRTRPASARNAQTGKPRRDRAPAKQKSRRHANEAAAIRTLLNLSSSQAQTQASGVIDVDRDGMGEYGYFAEMAGTINLRGSGKKLGPSRITPPVLSKVFGRVRSATVMRSGYYFRIYLPNKARRPVQEADTGGGGRPRGRS